jgi:2-dehydropantoate 2-reductase
LATQLNWLIFGAGAIGTYLGGSLLLHGQKVIFIDHPDIASSLHEQGLKLSIHGQEYRILHPDVFSSLSTALAMSSFDIAIFALKSFDTQYAVESLRPYLSSIPPVLCLQNGVENESILQASLGQSNVIAGTVTSAILRRGTGDVVLERLRGVGVARDHPLSAQIVQDFSEAHLNAHLITSSSGMKWSKMLTNLLANASSAILDMSPSEILRHPVLYRVEIDQLREAIAVMRALHIPIVDLPGTPIRIFCWALIQLPPSLSQPFISRMAGRGRGKKMPSFHLDLHSGRSKSEVDYLNGAVVRFGERIGVPTPVNRWLNQTLLGLVSGNLPLDTYSHQPDKLIQSIYSDAKSE